MQILKNFVFSTIAASPLILMILLPFANSSQQHSKEAISRNTGHKVNPQLFFEITIHGLSLWASIGFLMPLGILIIKMSHGEKCEQKLRTLFSIHVTLQILSLLVATTAAIMSIKNFDNSLKNNHQRIGLVLYGAIWIQAFSGFIRPHREIKGRRRWFLVHWLLGTAVCALGIMNIYTGLQAYHRRTQKNIRHWSLFFTIEICCIVFVYLFQDKWEYIKRQGTNLENDPITRVKEQNQKRKLTELC